MKNRTIPIKEGLEPGMNNSDMFTERQNTEPLYSVTLSEIIKEFNLEILHAPEGMGERKIYTDEVNRPALQLAGFFDYFDPKRLQLIGRVETTYVEQFDSEQRQDIFEKFLSRNITGIIFSRSIEPSAECMEMAVKYNTPILRSSDSTSGLMSAVIAFLKVQLAPRITRHGVLVEVYGEGILLLGESGVGKSETAIELVKRGHRLIADDAVEIQAGIQQIARWLGAGADPALYRAERYRCGGCAAHLRYGRNQGHGKDRFDPSD